MTWTHENASKSTVVTRGDAPQHHAICYNPAFTQGRVNLFHDHAKDELFEALTQRLGVSRCFFDEMIRWVTQFVQVRPIELRELGDCDLNDDPMIEHKINSKLKHVSAIAHISAA
jgi:hypothetical protein